MIVQHAAWMTRHLRRLAGGDHEIHEDLSWEIEKLQRKVERKVAAQRRAMFSKTSGLEDAKSTLTKKSGREPTT